MKNSSKNFVFWKLPKKLDFLYKKSGDLLFYSICLDSRKLKFQNGGRVTGAALFWEPFCVILTD